MTQQELASRLDLANHHANSTPEDVDKLCSEVVQYGFNSAFVNPTYIALAKQKLGGRAKVGTAFSFPLGQDTVEMKVFAAKEAIALGADELDIVPNNGLLVVSDLAMYARELTAIVSAARAVRKDIIIKFIIETGYFIKDETISAEELALGKKQITRASQAIGESGADFVKICTGMGPRGASVNDIKIVREAIGTRIRIKAAGGITNRAIAESFITAGADRIGTSSAVEIVTSGKLFAKKYQG